MNAYQHYEDHLGILYSWVQGNTESQRIQFLDRLDALPGSGNRVMSVLDLGAGNGVQSLALAQRGFEVYALDFNRHLLEELKAHDPEDRITVIHGDMRSFPAQISRSFDLITCCGDTLPHLDDSEEVDELFQNCFEQLKPGGSLLLSFRDYSEAVEGTEQAIPVRSEEHRLFTCFLRYEAERVRVSDFYQEYRQNSWEQKLSSYYKLRLNPEDILDRLDVLGFRLLKKSDTGDMIWISATKP